jgi:hypothetical protein
VALTDVFNGCSWGQQRDEMEDESGGGCSWGTCRDGRWRRLTLGSVLCCLIINAGGWTIGAGTKGT